MKCDLCKSEYTLDYDMRGRWKNVDENLCDLCYWKMRADSFYGALSSMEIEIDRLRAEVKHYKDHFKEIVEKSEGFNKPPMIVTDAELYGINKSLHTEIERLQALLKMADIQIKLKDDLIMEMEMEKRALKPGEVRAKWFCPALCCDPKIDGFGWCCNCQTQAVLVEVKG